MANDPVSHSASTGAVKVTGLVEFAAHLKEIDEGLPLALKGILLDGALIVARETVRGAPVGTDADRDTHPGALARSVKFGAVLTAKSVYSWVSVGGRGAAGDYVGPIVFGNPHHNIEGNPFPYRALDKAGPIIFTKAAMGVEKLVNEVYAREALANG